MKQRLDQALAARGLVATRSQAESWIRLGKVFVDGRKAAKPGELISSEARVELRATEQYASRAGLKLASVAQVLHLDFAGKIVLDAGSSTGGFTDFALQHGARKVIAVDVGKGQLHPALRENPRVELHEQTDIRAIALAPPTLQERATASAHDTAQSPSAGTAGQYPTPEVGGKIYLAEQPDIILADLSFISLRDVLPHLRTVASPRTVIVAMVKPQFEAGQSGLKHKGVIKNDRIRRDILKQFEEWAMHNFVILAKADSEVAGARGNLERFYALRLAAQ